MIDRNDRTIALVDNMNRACNKRNDGLAHTRDERMGISFLVIFVELDVVLSNDKKEKRDKRKREGERGGEVQGMAGDKVGCLGVFPG